MQAPPGYLEAIHAAHRAGRLTDDDIVHLQDIIYDPCDNHPTRPGKGVVGPHRWCETCFAALYPQWSKEHRNGVIV